MAFHLANRCTIAECAQTDGANAIHQKWNCKLARCCVHRCVFHYLFDHQLKCICVLWKVRERSSLKLINSIINKRTSNQTSWTFPWTSITKCMAVSRRKFGGGGRDREIDRLIVWFKFRALVLMHFRAYTRAVSLFKNKWISPFIVFTSGLSRILDARSRRAAITYRGRKYA